jgi:hypothetical protein
MVLPDLVGTRTFVCGDMIIFYGDERFSSKGTDQVNVIQKITMSY